LQVVVAPHTHSHEKQIYKSKSDEVKTYDTIKTEETRHRNAFDITTVLTIRINGQREEV